MLITVERFFNDAMGPKLAVKLVNGKFVKLIKRGLDLEMKMHFKKY